VDVRIWWL